MALNEKKLQMRTDKKVVKFINKSAVIATRQK